MCDPPPAAATSIAATSIAATSIAATSIAATSIAATSIAATSIAATSIAAAAALTAVVAFARRQAPCCSGAQGRWSHLPVHCLPTMPRPPGSSGGPLLRSAGPSAREGRGVSD